MKKKFNKFGQVSTITRYTAFTLSEVLITLAIIGVVAAMTIPLLVANYQERALVSALKKNYSLFSGIILKWQSDNSCEGNISECMTGYASWDCENGFKDIFEGKVKTVAQGGRSETLGLDWLPENTTIFDGSGIAIGEFAVSKNPTNSDAICHFLLADGTTFSLSFNDWGNQYGMITVDVNGSKPPNRVGKDTFYMGLTGKGLTPYFIYQNGGYEGGQCNSYSTSSCNPDDGYSPTAYVLTHDKLPDTNALFGK